VASKLFRRLTGSDSFTVVNPSASLDVEGFAVTSKAASCFAVAVVLEDTIHDKQIQERYKTTQKQRNKTNNKRLNLTGRLQNV